ncbi:MAG: ADP-ribosylglycohydrolase family protein [Terriglobales bacterium]
MANTRDAVYGCILGQAIGDALGEPVEFSGDLPKDVPALSPVNNHFTDDTQMMVAIAEALLAVPPHKTSSKAFMAELCLQIVEWRRHPLGGSHRSPGGACLEGAANLIAGKDWTESGGMRAKGNGTAMRSSVIGAFYHRDLDMAWHIGCLSSVPTHNNLEPILCSGAVALLCAASISGLSWPEAIKQVLMRIEDWENSVPYYPQVKVGSRYEDQNPWYTATHLSIAYVSAQSAKQDREFALWNGNDFATVPATAAAIYFNSRYQTFRDVAMNCASWTMDSDTTTAIAGAIAGSRFGLEGIPHSWRKDVELSTHFHELAERVWQASQEVGASKQAHSGAA